MEGAFCSFSNKQSQQQNGSKPKWSQQSSTLKDSKMEIHTCFTSNTFIFSDRLKFVKKLSKCQATLSGRNFAI